MQIEEREADGNELHLRTGQQAAEKTEWRVYRVAGQGDPQPGLPGCHGGGCPGSASREIAQTQSTPTQESSNNSQPSELSHWPVQLHLQNPNAAYFKGCNLLLAADCTAFTLGSFHQTLLKNKKVAIACPKLDSNKEQYVEKLTAMIDDAQIDTLTVAVMEVPCCSGLVQIAKLALQNAKRKCPIKIIVISVEGKILSETWM